MSKVGRGAKGILKGTIGTAGESSGNWCLGSSTAGTLLRGSGGIYHPWQKFFVGRVGLSPHRKFKSPVSYSYFFILFARTVLYHRNRHIETSSSLNPKTSTGERYNFFIIFTFFSEDWLDPLSESSFIHPANPSHTVKSWIRLRACLYCTGKPIFH